MSIPPSGASEPGVEFSTGAETPTEDDAALGTMAFLLRMRARGISNVDVLRALEMTPRLAFAPYRYADLAARDMPLPIGCGQTMSQPYEFARILEALNLRKRHRMLEIGTGSGYGSALLSPLAGEVISYERFQSLALEAPLRLRRFFAGNVFVRWGDGIEEARNDGLFDRIYVDAAIDEEQLAQLLNCLAERGALIAPVRSEAGGARLIRVRDKQSSFARDDLGPCQAAPILSGVSRAL